MALNGDYRQGQRPDEDELSHAEMEVRWLLPYADMLTLLVALFVLLYAIAVPNNTRAEALQKSINEAFNGSNPTVGQSPSNTQSNVPKDSPGQHLMNAGVSLQELQSAVQHVDARRREDDRLKRLQEKVRAVAKRQSMANAISTSITERGLVVRIVSDDVLFDTASSRIRSKAARALREVADAIRSESNHVRVEGHTDNVPINSSEFPSNWELSSDRAISVLHLMNNEGIAARRLSASGYANQRPLASNQAPSGRAKNRRVEIVVLRSTTPSSPEDAITPSP